MNCQQCGAPVDWDGVRPVSVCAFCNSIQSIVMSTDSEDGVVSFDQAGESDCPRCHHQLSKAAMDGMQVEHCSECRGVLIEGETFAMLVRQRRAKFTGAEARSVPVDPAQLSVIVHCPGCESKMEVHPYYGPGNIVVDSCASCRLVWLDRGEMARVEAAPGRR